MRTLLLLLFSTLGLLSALRAQDTAADTLDRRGKVWLDGSADLNASFDQLRAGYFFTDRLLVGTGLSIIGNDDVYVSPFVRYYLNGPDHRWRPYGEAGLELAVGRFGIEENYAALGVERAFNTTTLLNLEMRYTNLNGRRDSYSIRGRLNTLLGGPAWKKAAENHFAAGSFILGNQLFEAGINTANSFSFNYVNLSPSIDYFLTDRLALQGRLNVSRSAFDQSLSATNQDYSAWFADFRGGARYYLTTKSLFNLFAEGGVTYGFRSLVRETLAGNERTSSDFLRADLGLGTSVFINRNTSIDFGVNVNKNLLEPRDAYLDGFLKLKFWF